MADRKEIKLLDALNLMEDVDQNGQPVSFQVKFVKYNRQNEQGGELKEIKRATKAERPGSVRAATAKSNKAASDAGMNERKNPRHRQNTTKNIFDLDSSRVVKFNIRLLTEFNGMKVVY